MLVWFMVFLRLHVQQANSIISMYMALTMATAALTHTKTTPSFCIFHFPCWLAAKLLPDDFNQTVGVH